MTAAVDPMASLPPDATPEQKDAYWFQHVYQGDKVPQLTLRAVLMGGILGMLMAASNLYTTLAIGWGFGVAITACVMSFVIWNIFRLISGKLLLSIFCGMGLVVLLGTVAVLHFVTKHIELTTAGWLAGSGVAAFLLFYALLRKPVSQMSILENNCMQSTASAAGYSTGATIATMFGALLLLQEPGEGQTNADIKNIAIQPVWVVAGFTMLTGLMGVFLAVPLKRQMINHEQLRFPSGVAAAATLKSLYSGSKDAITKAYALIAGIGIGALVGVLNTGEGTLKLLDRITPSFLRLPELVPHDGLWKVHGKGFPAFGFEPSVLLIAAGIITRLRVSLSMLAGALILHLWVAPYLVSLDQHTVGSGWTKQADVWVFDARTRDKDYITNMPVNVRADINAQAVAAKPEAFQDDPVNKNKFTGSVLRVQVWSLWGGTAVMVFASLTAVALQWRTVVRAFTGLGASKSGDGAGDPLAAIEVPVRWMIIGMVPIAAGMLGLQIVAFHISWWAGCIAIAASFFLALVACRATGETDTTPIGAMGKVMQLMFAVFHPGKIVPNLASAGIAANTASGAADLLTDLKSGYLLGANPRRQFLAQFTGVFFGTMAIVPVWYLMIPTKAALEKFAAPATRQWEAVARVLTKGVDQLPQSAQMAILIGALVGIALPIIEKYCSPKVRGYLPSAMGLGLSWVIPFGSALGFAIGAVFGRGWELVNRKNADHYSIPVASGLIAGESLAKAIIAMAATAMGLLGG
ncbi:MAG: peptide transporter [Phycisphaerae bacterium]|nr:MAG: peptide transporter [Phycisphaerae bacterium]